MFQVDLPPDTPKWESGTVDIEKEVRNAVLEERQRCVKILSSAMKRYTGTTAALVLETLVDEILGD